MTILLELAGIFLVAWLTLGVLALLMLWGLTAVFRRADRHGEPMTAEEMDAIAEAVREEDIDAMVAQWAREMRP